MPEAERIHCQNSVKLVLKYLTTGLDYSLGFVPFPPHELKTSEFDNSLIQNEPRYENCQSNWQEDIDDGSPSVIEVVLKGEPVI